MHHRAISVRLNGLGKNIKRFVHFFTIVTVTDSKKEAKEIRDAGKQTSVSPVSSFPQYYYGYSLVSEISLSLLLFSIEVTTTCSLSSLLSHV